MSFPNAFRRILRGVQLLAATKLNLQGCCQSPPLEEGWLREKKSCEATLDAQTGWSEMFLTTPSAPIKGCLRRYFLQVAAPPPLEEGNRSHFTISRAKAAFLEAIA